MAFLSLARTISSGCLDPEHDLLGASRQDTFDWVSLAKIHFIAGVSSYQDEFHSRALYVKANKQGGKAGGRGKPSRLRKLHQQAFNAHIAM